MLQWAEHEPWLAYHDLDMMEDLREQDFRVGVVVDRIVTSPQFMQIRGTEFLLAE